MCCAVLSCSVKSNSLRTHGLQPTRLLCPWGFFRQEYWYKLTCPPPGDFPNPGIEPRSPTFQADSLPSEPPGKPKNTKVGSNTGVGSLSPLQRVFLTQESNQGLLHCRWILYQLSSQGSPLLSGTRLKILKAVSSIFIFFKSFLKAQHSPPLQRLWIFLFEPKSFLKVKVTQSCPTLCDPMDQTVHGILHAKILEWVAFPFSRVSSQPRDQTQVSCIAGRFFTS